MTGQPSLSRPLEGIRVISAGGLGPIAFCCMLLADLGAEVIRVERPARTATPMPPGLTGSIDILGRGQSRIELDFKKPEDVEVLLGMVTDADVLLEGFRPGVMERLGLGPADCAKRNPRLVYGRLTGWGQDGPLAQRAGHDINYLAVAGALDLIGEAGGKPVPPLNLVGDFAGSSLFTAYGVLAAIIRRDRTGEGCVIDGAIVDGVSALMAQVREIEPVGALARGRGCNLLDGGAPCYGVYACADGKYVAVGAVEPHFFKSLIELIGLEPADFDANSDAGWERERNLIAEAFLGKTRDEWIALAKEDDVCLSPVLTPEESRADPHLRERGVLVEREGALQPGPAPRFLPLG